MNKWLAVCALCAASSFGSGAAAQQAGERVTIPAPTLKIELPDRRYYMDSAEFDDFRGWYQLSNGQTLNLSGKGKFMYAEIDQQGPHRIVATGHNAFVALDRQLKMRIDWRDDGSVGGEVLMVVPRQTAGGGVTEEVVALVMR
ncbi:hypothetical protein LJR289_003504 [Pseudoduganella sp. LjRoot289]|uniref:hypothetical protein n=1 Tax=Pseudoduganella sp. LjRoot289 TaxID=3342314 RepID=UPI003ECEA51F